MFSKAPSFSSIAKIVIVLGALMAGASDAVAIAHGSRADKMSRFPHIILWAWERRENLSFDSVIVRPRFQPLTVPPRTTLIAVARIEDDRRTSPTLSVSQRVRASRIIAWFANASTAAIQIDFDALRSERRFYRDLLTDVRHRLPASIPLSMTALASWCLDDDWISGLPADEAVPMLYRMGPDASAITAYLRGGGEFGPVSSRNSVGLSLDAQVTGLPAAGKRVYLFSPRPWTAEAERYAIVQVVK